MLSMQQVLLSLFAASAVQAHVSSDYNSATVDVDCLAELDAKAVSCSLSVLLSSPHSCLLP